MSLHSRGPSRFGYLQAAQLFFQSLLRGRQRRLRRSERFRFEGPIDIQVLEDRVLLAGDPLDGSDSVAVAQPVGDGAYMLYQSHVGTVTPSDVASSQQLQGSGSQNLNAIVQNQPGTFDIVLHFGPQINSNAAAKSAFLRAAAFWETQFTDPITLNIDVEYGTSDIFGTAFGATTLGLTQSETNLMVYSDVRQAMILDASNDESLTNSLPTPGNLKYYNTSGSASASQTYLNVNRANALALGFTLLPGGASHVDSGVVIDASISFNSQFSFDFDKSNGVTAGTYDFEGVALHELGHVLGFVSSADSVATVGFPNLHLTPLDLFRIGSGTGATTFSTAPRFLLPTNDGGYPVFYDGKFDTSAFRGRPGISPSIITGDIPMSNGIGPFFSDGNQASHFKADEITGLNIGIMDPTLASGVSAVATKTDLRVLGLLGWDWRDNGQFSTAVPTITVNPKATTDTTPPLRGDISGDWPADIYVRLPAIHGNDTVTLLANGGLGGTTFGNGSFTLTNSSSSAANIARMDFILPKDGNSYYFETYQNNGDFVALTSPTTVGLLTPQADSNFNDQDVPGDIRILSLTFNDFNPGEFFSWDILIVDNANFTFATGNQLIGGLVKITLDNGITITNTLGAVAGNSLASSTTLTTPHYLHAINNNATFWDLSDNVLPALTPGTTYEVQTLIVDSSGAQATDSSTNELVIKLPTPPTVTSIYPLDDATTVSPFFSLVLMFTENMSKGTGNILIRRASDDSIFQTIDVTSSNVSIFNGNQVSISHNTLTEETDYYVEIPATALKDQMNNAFAGFSGPTAWNFRTGDVTRPTIISLSPADNATGVAGTTNLVINFSENVVKGTGNILIRKSSDSSIAQTIAVTSSAVSIAGAVVTIDPADLASNTGYYVEIASTAFADSSNNKYVGMGGTSTWNFTTADVAPPVLISRSPSDNSTTVREDTDLVLTFNENIAKGTGNILIRKSSDNSIAQTIDVTSSTVTISGAQVTINPADLSSLVGYYIEIPSTALLDLAGNAYAGISGPTAWNFTTTDKLPPTIVSFSPADNATGVSVLTDLVLTFDDTILKASGTILIRKASDDSIVQSISLSDFGVSTNGKTLTLDANPAVKFALVGNTDYYVEFPGNAIQDSSGNFFPGIADKTTWNFKTEFIPVLGPLDTTFDSDGIDVTPLDAVYGDGASAVALQADGKIVAVGGRLTGTSTSELTVSRYNSDGSLDSTFGNGGSVSTSFGGTSAYANAVVIQPDGRIVVVGQTLNTSLDFAVARYNPNGSLDNSFDLDGRLTLSFGGSPDTANGVAIDDQGRIVVAGTGNNQFAVVRLNSDGSLDSTFDGDGSLTFNFGTGNCFASALTVQPDGRIVVVGQTGQGDNNSHFGIIRLLPTGALDPAFDGDGFRTLTFDGNADTATSVVIDGDNQILVAGLALIGATGGFDFALARFGSTGALDATFGNGGKVTTDFGRIRDTAEGVRMQANGKIVVAGYSSDNAGRVDTALVRYLPNGALDTSFDTDGKVVTDMANGERDQASDLILQPDGGIVIAGQALADGHDYDTLLSRYLGDPVPLLTSLSPTDNASGVSVGSNLVLTFNQSVAKGTGNILIKNASDGSVVQTIDVTSGAVTASGAVVTINPSDLVRGTNYYIEIPASALTDLAGHVAAAITGPRAWNFRTAEYATAAVAKISDGTESSTPTNGKFQVTITEARTTDTVLNYLVTGTATGGAGQDYATLSGTVTIPAGQTSADIDVEVLDNAIVEGNETVVVTLTGFGSQDPELILNPLAALRTASVAIADDDTATLLLNDANANETDGAMLFTLTSDKAFDVDVIIDVLFTSVTATGSGVDYTSAVQHITLPAGQTSRTISVAVTDDNLVEATETFSASFSPSSLPISYQGDLTDTGTGTITDNDTATFTINSATAGEGAGVLVFNLTTNQPLDIDVTIDVSFTDATAAGGMTDYASAVQHITFIAGQATRSVSVTLNNDSLVEATETFVVALSTNTTLDGRRVDLSDTGVGTISDNDTAAFTLNNAAADESAGVLTFSLTTNLALDIAVTIDVTFTDGTASGGGTDYTSNVQHITFLAGQTSQTISVQLNDDSLNEADESFSAALSLATAIGDRNVDISETGIGTILDDDVATFTINSVTANESAGALVFNLTTDMALTSDFTVDVTFLNGTAVGSGTDFVSTVQHVTFLAGQTTKTVSVPLNEDSQVEATESFTATLSTTAAPGHPHVDLSDTGTGTISDDDTATFAINDIISTETTGALTFTVTVSCPLDIDVTVDVTFSDLTATGGGADYASSIKHVTIPAGQTNNTITVALNDDSLVEATETFLAALSSATAFGNRAVNLSDTGTGTISDNDTATFTIDSITADEGAGALVLSLTTGRALDIDLTVDVIFSGGTASGGGADYVNTPQHLTFLAGQTSQSVSIPLIDNNLAESTETFSATLGSGTPRGDRHVDLSDTGTGTITDNDTATFTIDNVTANESAGVLAFTLATSQPLDVNVVVDVTFFDGSATGNGTDYDSTVQHITFFAGQTTHSVNVPLSLDNFVEAAEQFTAALSTSTSLGDRSVNFSDTSTGKIIDTDTPTFTIDDMTANESAGVLVFTLATSKAFDIDVTIDVTLADSTATGGGTDYANTVQHVTFLAGQTSKIVSVPLNNDNLVEGPESFTATLSTATELGGRSIDLSDVGTGIIADNDAATFTINNVTSAEGSGSLVFSLTTDKVLDFAITVDVTLTGGTATGGGSDFNSTVQQITFQPGQTSRTVSVAITNDGVVESTESFTVTLSTSQALGGHNLDLSDTGTGTVTDDDTAVFTISDAAANENTGSVVLNLSSDHDLDTDVTIDVTINSGSAIGGGTDFVSTTKHVLFSAGQISRTVTVTLTDDNLVEGTETFTASLTTLTELGDRHINLNDTGVGTILDTDTASVSISQVTDGAESLVPTNGKFRITQTATSSTNTIVSYSIGGTAISGSDYGALTGTATILAGQPAVDIDVNVLNDTLLDGPRSVVLTLIGFGSHDADITLAAEPAARTATVDITDDDLLQITSASSASVAENTPATTPAVLIAANNTLDNPLTFELTGPDAHLFNISNTSGKLTFVASPNFENALDQGADNHYHITVIVTDSLTHTTSQDLVITVTNVGESPTNLAASPTTIAEGLPAGSVIGTLSSTDPDAGDTFIYTLATGAGSSDNGDFQIVGTQLRTSQSLNFEVQSSYSVRIRTTDSSGLTLEKFFTITVTDVNEAPTDITLSASVIPENQPQGTLVGTLSGSDPDTRDTLTLTLAVGIGNTDNGLFQIVGNTLRTAQPLNFETHAAYSIRVRATDFSGSTFEKILTITATNVSESPTGLALSANTVAENEAAGKSIGDLSSTDPDTGDSFTYSLVSGSGSTDNSLFQITGNTLRTAQPLNFESQVTYAIRIRTTDLAGLTLENVFTITVTNVNEQPTNLTLSATTIAENRPAGTGIGTLSSTDPDAGDAFTYSLVTGPGSTDNAGFQIVGNTLQATQSLNFEAQAAYSIRVRTTDLGGQTFEKTVTITATNTNETPNDLALSSSMVVENQPAGTTVGTLSGIDPDAGDTLTYALVTGTGSADNALFQVVGNSLRTTQPLNFEAQATYSIRIRTTDFAGLTFDKSLIVTTTNANENPTDSALSAATIAENQPSATPIGTLSSTDPDAGDTFTYTLVSGAGSTDNSFFQIVGNSLRTAQPLSFETRSAYSIRIRTTDFGGLTFDKTYTINVLNVNEIPTNLGLSVSTVAESQPAGTSVALLSTTDPDLGDTFTYALVPGTGSTNNAFFRIVGNTLQTGQPLDFETQSGYLIRIRTTDVGGMSFEKTFTIAALDANETPTDLMLSANTVAENQSAETTVGTLTGSDQDIGDSLTYSLVPGTGDNDNAFFQVFGNTLQTSLPLDFDSQPTYSVLVRVTDRGGLTFDKSLTITATNVNEAPTHVALSATAIDENQPAGTSIGTLSTTDPDFGSSFSYGLVSGAGGNDNALFRIIGNSLRTTQPLDFETQATYSIRVRTTDNDGLTFDNTFTVTITNLNETPTNQALSATTVAENQPVGTLIATLSSTDPDAGDTLTYTLVPGTGSQDNSFFQIAGNTLRTAQVLNFEAQGTYSIRIRATDSGGLTIDKNYIVTATNVNEEPTDLALSDHSTAESRSLRARTYWRNRTVARCASTSLAKAIQGLRSGSNWTARRARSALRSWQISS